MKIMSILLIMNLLITLMKVGALVIIMLKYRIILRLRKLEV